MDDKKIGWGQLLLLLFMCRAFTLMTFVPLAAKGEDLSMQLTAAAIGTLIQAALMIPIVLLKKSVTGAVLEKNKAAGIFTSVLYLIFFFFYAAGSLLRFKAFLSARFFHDASGILWTAVFLAVCVYCGSLGLEALGRSAALLFWLFIAALIFMCASSARNFDPINLSCGTLRTESLSAAIMNDLSRSGEICAAAFLAGRVRERLRCGIYGLLVSKLALVSATAVLITAVLGDFAEFTDYPFLSVGTFGSARFIQRGDALYLIVWTITAVVGIALFLYIAGGLIGEVFPKSRFRESIAAIVVFALTIFAAFDNTRFSGMYNVVCSGLAVVLLAGVIPLIVLIIERKRKGRKVNA